MTLEFTGESEILPKLHREFYGQPLQQMQFLVSGKDEQGEVIDVPRVPVFYADVIGRRLQAPEDVIDTWRNNYVFTGDGSTAGLEGDHLLVLDAKALRKMKPAPKSKYDQGALVLSGDRAWDDLKEQKNDVLYLTADEVAEAHGKGYVKKDGVWVPANNSVGKYWNHLARGQNLREYAELVSEKSPQSESIMNVYFNRTTSNGKPTMRSVVAGRFDSDSNANGNYSLNYDNGRLVGVAPEALVAREKALEARVQDAIAGGLSFRRNDGLLYVPVHQSAADQLK